MELNTSTYWHKASYNKFLDNMLPELLADRLPVAGYRVEPSGEYTCKLKVVLSSKSGDVEVGYDNIPQPDEEGIFKVGDSRRIVMPTVSQAKLDEAEIRCVGEQLCDYIEQRLGEAPSEISWNELLVRLWLPLDKWIMEFLQSADTSDNVADLNWLAKYGHLRRITLAERIPMGEREKIFAPENFGRTCPFETPEGPNIGHILSVSVGAEIRDGKLIVANGQPEAALGLTASMVPFLEHNDPNRQLMGVNMMRQWFVLPDPEPAYVQSGDEPDAPDFWCGRNLLTAFVSWGVGTFEDGVVISQSAANRLNYPYPVEPGDKLSNRHGSKGVVSTILPDEEMPHLSDGTPVELVFSFIGCHTRLNFGQIREAIISRIARAEGTPAIVPPFHAPGEDELRKRLKRAGLPESGMETLTLGRGGKRLLRPSTAGWVYWGRLCHLARNKIHASIEKPLASQMQGELEYYALRDVRAFENIRSHFNTCAAERSDAGELKLRVAAGKVEQAAPPTPKFSELVRRLSAAGIDAVLKKDKLTFQFAQSKGTGIKLSSAVSHPWLRDRELTEVETFEELPEYGELVGANVKVKGMLESHAPESLVQKASERLDTCVRNYFDAILTPGDLRFRARILFSGRTVLAPAMDLHIDQVGIAEEIAWTIFGPLVIGELGNDKEVRARSQRAVRILDEIMARSWILVNRAPTLTPTTILAFHPIRCTGNVIRLHPLACRLMNADFDGDQVAVFLPVSEDAQREAGERLSIAGHLRRDSDLISEVFPENDALWGLAELSLRSDGLKKISSIAGGRMEIPEGFVTRTAIVNAMRAVMARDGVNKTLEILERLLWCGFEIAKESGASISPFIGTVLKRPLEPLSDDVELWNAYAGELSEEIASRTDFADENIGPQLLAVKSGARGNLRQLVGLTTAWSTARDFHGKPIQIHHGYREGLTLEEIKAVVLSARMGLIQTVLECDRTCYSSRQSGMTNGFNVLARAMRSEHPGIVFARAAATGEVDPLTDVDSRLFVGLPIQNRL